MQKMRASLFRSLPFAALMIVRSSTACQGGDGWEQRTRDDIEMDMSSTSCGQVRQPFRATLHRDVVTEQLSCDDQLGACGGPHRASTCEGNVEWYEVKRTRNVPMRVVGARGCQIEIDGGSGPCTATVVSGEAIEVVADSAGLAGVDLDVDVDGHTTRTGILVEFTVDGSCPPTRSPGAPPDAAVDVRDEASDAQVDALVDGGPPSDAS
jgi:hypothetical protein